MRNKIIQASYVSLDIICPCNFGITRIIPFDQGLKYGMHYASLYVNGVLLYTY